MTYYRNRYVYIPCPLTNMQQQIIKLTLTNNPNSNQILYFNINYIEDFQQIHSTTSESSFTRIHDIRGNYYDVKESAEDIYNIINNIKETKDDKY